MKDKSTSSWQAQIGKHKNHISDNQLKLEQLATQQQMMPVWMLTMLMNAPSYKGYNRQPTQGLLTGLETPPTPSAAVEIARKLPTPATSIASSLSSAGHFATTAPLSRKLCSLGDKPEKISNAPKAPAINLNKIWENDVKPHLDAACRRAEEVLNTKTDEDLNQLSQEESEDLLVKIWYGEEAAEILQAERSKQKSPMPGIPQPSAEKATCVDDECSSDTSTRMRMG